MRRRFPVLLTVLLLSAIGASVYGHGHPYGQSPIPKEPDVRKITRVALLSAYTREFSPSNAVSPQPQVLGAQQDEPSVAAWAYLSLTCFLMSVSLCFIALLPSGNHVFHHGA